MKAFRHTGRHDGTKVQLPKCAELSYIERENRGWIFANERERQCLMNTVKGRSVGQQWREEESKSKVLEEANETSLVNFFSKLGILFREQPTHDVRPWSNMHIVLRSMILLHHL